MNKIQMIIKLRKGLRVDEVQDIRNFITNIRSPSGFKYCNYLNDSLAGNISLKISFSRYYDGINAYMITKEKECWEVQRHFCDCLRQHPLLTDVTISLVRVDIPFTYMIPQDREFYSYEKIFQIFDYIYREDNTNAVSKSHYKANEVNEERFCVDVVYLAANDTRIVIKSQSNDIQAKDKNEFNSIALRYPDLKRRMRIEVSKHIKKADFSLQEFKEYDIYSQYVPRFKQEILDSILNLDKIEAFYQAKSKELAAELKQFKANSPNFDYTIFILKNISRIYDYDIIRRAMKMFIENIKTRESAITRIRKVLGEYEKDNNIIVMEVYKELYMLRDSIIRQRLRQKSKYRTFKY